MGFGISFIAILLSGTSSFVCDIDEKILKQNEKNGDISIIISIWEVSSFQPLPQ